MNEAGGGCSAATQETDCVLAFGPREIADALPFDMLIERLRQAFADSDALPERHHHEYDHDAGRNALLLMPCWDARYLGLKVVVVAPSNVQRDLPSLSSTYTLFDKRTGRTLARFDGNAITSRRTAAASALAASFLAKPDARRMLVAGTGRVASLLPAAYRAVRPIERVDVYSRDASRADLLVQSLRNDGFDALACHDLQAGVSAADIVSCATLADEIIVRGEWLRPGQFVDLIGSFQPHAREADSATVARANVAIDTHAALDEAGDLIIPASENAWRHDQVATTLAQLCRGVHPGRRRRDELWLFKSVGTAIEDLTAAQAIFEQAA